MRMRKEMQEEEAAKRIAKVAPGWPLKFRLSGKGVRCGRLAEVGGMEPE